VKLFFFLHSAVLVSSLCLLNIEVTRMRSRKQRLLWM